MDGVIKKNRQLESIMNFESKYIMKISILFLSKGLNIFIKFYELSTLILSVLKIWFFDDELVIKNGFKIFQ